MTNDNEKLIAEAAKAMFLRQNPRSSWEMIPSNDMHRVDWMTDARTAFAVFEKAHTPTDDEREAPTQELCDRCGWATSGHLRSQYGLDCPPGGSRPGFRRSEVPEPSRDPGWSHPEAVYSPEVFMAIQELLNEARGEPMHALRLAVSRKLSEPQGEPSDAGVQAFVRGFYPLHPTATLADWSDDFIDRVRAGLRAAGGVR